MSEQRPIDTHPTRISQAVKVLLSAAVGLVLALTIGAFQIAGIISMGLAHPLITLAWLVAVIAVWGWLSSKTQKHVGKTVLLTALILGIIFIITDFWMVRLKAEQEHRPPPSLNEWLLPAATYIRSLPWWWIAGSLGVGLLSGAWLFRVFRHSKTAGEVKKLQGHIAELESERAALEGRIEKLNAQHQSEKAGLGERIERLNQYEWLHEIAEAQAKEINRYVILIRVVMSISPTSHEIAFYFHIRNKSNYAITVDVPQGDFIHFNGRPLYYPVKVINRDFECAALEDQELAIEQPLRKEEAERISEFGDNAYFYFSLEHLNFSVKGVGRFAQIVIPQPLVTTIKPEFPAPNVKKLSDRIKELERGTAALEKGKSELEAVKNRYGWLYTAADAQAEDIQQYVIVERFHLCDKILTGDDPHLNFWVAFYNMSVFDLALHKDKVEGHITFRGERLLEGKEIRYPTDVIPSSRDGHFNVKQRLTQREAGLIAGCTNEELKSLLHIHELGIVISGGERFPQIGRTPLKLPSWIEVSKEAQDTEVAELKRQVATLQSKLKSMSAAGPNLVFLGAQISVVHIDEKGVIQDGGDGDRTLTAVIAKFENKARPTRKVSPAKSVIAHIAYEVGRREYPYSIDKGAWVGEEYNQVDFEVGDTRGLMIAAVMSVGNNVVNYQNNNDGPDRRGKLTVVPLRDSDQFIVEVELVVRGSSEAGRKFRYKLTLRPTPLLELIEPQSIEPESPE